MSSLKKTCDFCVRRKRACDGSAIRRCSSCIAAKQPECHYRSRRPWGSQNSGSEFNSPQALVGRSFWLVYGETAPALAEGDEGSTPTDSGSSDDGLMPPLKRGRFSPSPATGLIGLQENKFLGDFFGCLGFLSLASEGTIRGAMVGVMLARASRQHQNHLGSRSPSPVSPWLAEEDAGGVWESSDVRGDGGWSNALVADIGSGALASDPATCVLWCAIALGALVRGCPLDHVDRYVELAQDLLLACPDGATLGMARAYVTMAVVYNFLGDQVHNYEYFKLANRIVHVLPPEEIPRGFRELLQYTGLAWAMETKLASVEDTTSYWENVPPIWELSESVMERDICGFVLAVTLRVNQPFVDDGVGHALVAKQQQQQLNDDARVATASSHLEDTEEFDRVCLDNVEACGDVQKESVLPEMLRLEKCIEISSTRLGLGGLLYYGELGYLQLLNKETASKASMRRCVEVIVRYPGLCRYNIWWHLSHSLFESVQIFQSRVEYEALRAAYNSVRPVWAPPVPPFEDWRGVSDICDHPCCRRVGPQMRSAGAWVSEARAATACFPEARENGGPEER